ELLQGHLRSAVKFVYDHNGGRPGNGNGVEFVGEFVIVAKVAVDQRRHSGLNGRALIGDGRAARGNVDGRTTDRVDCKSYRPPVYPTDHCRVWSDRYYALVSHDHDGILPGQFAV